MWLLVLIVWVAVVWAGVVFATMIFPIALLGSTLVAVGLYLLQARAILVPDSSAGLSPVPPPKTGKGRDPAYPHYLSSQVWKDGRAILRTTAPSIRIKTDKTLRSVTNALMSGRRAWFLFPVWFGICGGIVSAVVPVFMIGVLIMLMYAVTVALGMLVWLVCVGMLRAVEAVFMLAHRILQTCPYPGCYARFTLPVYACSTCGRKHANLRPDLNGAARHVCQCGTRLPTTIPLGRYRLQAYCPHCDRLLPTRVGRVRIEPLPFVGGPDAGKTTFMALGVDAIHGAVDAAGGQVLFADKSDEQAFRKLRGELSSGRISKTLPDLPKAVMLDVALPGRTGDSRILYLFDPSGEHYTGASKVEEMRYLAHGEALILVIDPFALPDVQDHLLESERQALTAKGVVLSREDPADTFTRLRNELASRADGGKQRRVAVVLTKADLLRQTTSGRGIDDLAAWLTLMGLGNLVRELNHQGAEVRYLASGLPPQRPQIAELMGWLSGLRLTGHLADGSSPAAVELTAGDVRRPWDTKPRPVGHLPLSYLIFRRALAGATMMTSALMLIMFSLLLLSTWMPNDESATLAASAAPQAAPIPLELAGRWQGIVRPTGSDDYRVRLALTEGAAAGERAGTVDYPELRCSGTLTLEPVADSSGAPVIRQEITEDPGDRCVATGWIALARMSDGKLEYRWFSLLDDVSEGGTPGVIAKLDRRT
ncbi:hypothetical protein AB0F17_49295 [Nonomuraea sp. NPDC026600]|uniref:TRAFAC clade GTPase domain-containing protein n=1 Tax=Nonomuraea sp. NPDC026600 TaxID=3155363 RepID=UPI0033DD352B